MVGVFPKRELLRTLSALRQDESRRAPGYGSEAPRENHLDFPERNFQGIDTQSPHMWLTQAIPESRKFFPKQILHLHQKYLWDLCVAL